jgi:predicted transcriptional regulator
MKTRFIVIPVSLGINIDDIISTDLTDLTTESRSELDKALNIAKAVQNIKTEKTKQKEEKTTKLQQNIIKLYEAIKNATTTGISTKEMKVLLNDDTANLSTLTTKIRLHLKEQDPELELEKVTRAGTVYYRFSK